MGREMVVAAQVVGRNRFAHGPSVTLGRRICGRIRVQSVACRAGQNKA
jgi:hypothetical protein